MGVPGPGDRARMIPAPMSNLRSSPLDGVLGLLKPVGMTSHDVVNILRRVAGTRRIGHTGTLDPGASGVLVLCLGRATRVAEFLAEVDKEYRVEVTFGRATDTGDAYGTTLRETPVDAVSRAALEALLPQFTGEIEQVPPMASAVHVGGQRLYDLARRGVTVEVPARRVTIYQLQLLEVLDAPPRARLHITCSKGTYIRRLCHDLGEVLGCGAFASFMVRTRVGRYELVAAHTLEEIDAVAGAGRLADLLESLDEAIAELPVVEISPAQQQAVIHGQALPLFKVARWQELLGARAVRLRDAHGLVALARVEAGALKPFKVLRDSN